ERSNTAEVSAAYTVKTFSASLDLYVVNNSAKIVTAGGTVFNQGRQEVKGADLGLQWLVPVTGLSQWKVWSYYSHYFSVDDTNTVKGVDVTTRSPDLADNKVKLGTTLVFNHNLDMTLLARYVGNRPTPISNPVGVVDSHTTLDFNVNWKDFWIKGLGVALRVANLSNAFYYDPGMRKANAGLGPAGFDGAGTWTGSNGYYNSLMPQPGRSVDLSVKFSF
ncbi:MAG TPA: TonB-dependent receptor, partial [Holophagaceae bacterium]